MKTNLFILIFLISVNIFTIQKPEIKNNFSILASNPLFLRAVSPNSEHIFADKFWLLSSNIDEMRNKENINLDIFLQTYKNILILDSNFEIPIIYASTFLASNLNRGDLAIELLQLAQILNPDSFQFLFTELIFQIIYLENSNKNELIQLANRVIKMPDYEKYIGKINVREWANDIITYLNQKNTQKEIQEVNRNWLKSVKD